MLITSKSGFLKSIGSNPSKKIWLAYIKPSLPLARIFFKKPDSFVKFTRNDCPEQSGIRMMMFLAQSVMKVKFSLRHTYSLQKLLPTRFLMKLAQKTIDISSIAE